MPKHKYNVGDLIRFKYSGYRYNDYNVMKLLDGHTCEITKGGIKQMYAKFVVNDGFGKPHMFNFIVYDHEVAETIFKAN